MLLLLLCGVVTHVMNVLCVIYSRAGASNTYHDLYILSCCGAFGMYTYTFKNNIKKFV